MCRCNGHKLEQWFAKLTHQLPTNSEDNSVIGDAKWKVSECNILRVFSFGYILEDLAPPTFCLCACCEDVPLLPALTIMKKKKKWRNPKVDYSKKT